MFYVSGITFSVFIGLTYGKLTNKLSPYWHCGMLVILMIISIGISQFSIEAKDNLFRANFNQSGSIDKNYDINGQQNLKTAIGEFFPTSIGTKNKTLSAIIDENRAQSGEQLRGCNMLFRHPQPVQIQIELAIIIFPPRELRIYRNLFNTTV